MGIARSDLFTLAKPFIRFYGCTIGVTQKSLWEVDAQGRTKGAPGRHKPPCGEPLSSVGGPWAGERRYPYRQAYGGSTQTSETKHHCHPVLGRRDGENQEPALGRLLSLHDPWKGRWRGNRAHKVRPLAAGVRHTTSAR